MHPAKGVACLLTETRVLLNPSELFWVVWDLLSTDIGNGKSLLAHDWNSSCSGSPLWPNIAKRLAYRREVAPNWDKDSLRTPDKTAVYA